MEVGKSARGDDFDIRLLDGRKREYGYDVREGEAGLRLDQFLARRLSWRSRTSVQQLVDEGHVRLEGRTARSSRRVAMGERIIVRLPRPLRDTERRAVRDPDASLRRLFEDDVLIAIDKPPDMSVHPAGRLLHQTVITELHREYRNFEDEEADCVPRLCHRLDLETSGVLLVAKTREALVFVQRQFARRQLRKEYQTLVHGEMEDDEGLVKLPLGPRLGGKVRHAMGVRHDDAGQPSSTQWKVIERFDGYTRLHIDLLTGRRHQIRVHMAAVGHPVVGDKIYGRDDEIFLRYLDCEMTEEDRTLLELHRQALHSSALTFKHPDKGQMRIASPWPADLKKFTDQLKRS